MLSRFRPASSESTASASVYLPVLKQGGDTNTIAVVDGVRRCAYQNLVDVPKQLVTKCVFDQSRFVKTAIGTLIDEGAIGLILTSIMILVFLGSMRATVAVFFSIPLSALATFIALSLGGGPDQQHGSGRAGAGVFAADRQFGGRAREYLSPPGDGRDRRKWRPRKAAVRSRCRCWQHADYRGCVLPSHVPLWRQQISVFGAGAGCGLSLFASYVVAMTVVPLFCARFIKLRPTMARLRRGW